MANARSLLYSIPIISSLLSTTANAKATGDIHDILPEYNLPKGILPNVPNSYTLSPVDGTFTVLLEHPCYVKFDGQLVYYSNTIKGQLSYGRISHVSGIQARIFLLWLSVNGMDMDTDSQMVDFHVGSLSHKLPAHHFQTLPSCINTAPAPAPCSRSSTSS